MTPATEKAAPIPAEDAVDTVASILASHDGRKYVCGPDFDLAYKIVSALLADRASQEERIREDVARLDWLEANSNVHVQYEGWEEDVWEVYRVNGGRSDREWSKIAESSSLRDAIDHARLRGDAS